MSFGYPTNQIDGYQELERAILYAHSKHVLMFAAASNSGANQDRAYPARDAHVICVHSTDSNGNRSKFSPTALRHDANIATIGEAVQSSWPVGKCDLVLNPDCVQCKSGTSYATPIAVGIAAFLLQYTRIHMPDIASMLKRQEKMTAVFLKIAEKTQSSRSRDDYSYVALSLFSDNLFGKDKKLIDITLEELLKR
jgi:subtilisin family serine protease